MRDGVIASIADLANRMSLIPLKMLIPNVAVGRLIGRGGFNVKRLMAESDAYIVCSREETASRHAQPTERVLTVMGSPHSQVCAGAGEPGVGERRRGLGGVGIRVGGGKTAWTGLGGSGSGRWTAQGGWVKDGVDWVGRTPTQNILLSMLSMLSINCSLAFACICRSAPQTKALRSILQLVGATLEGPGGSSSSDGPAYLDLAGP